MLHKKHSGLFFLIIFGFSHFFSFAMEKKKGKQSEKKKHQQKRNRKSSAQWKRKEVDLESRDEEQEVKEADKTTNRLENLSDRKVSELSALISFKLLINTQRIIENQERLRTEFKSFKDDPYNLNNFANSDPFFKSFENDFEEPKNS